MQFFSEPEAGSDLAGIRTQAVARRRPLDPQRLEDLEQRRLLRRLGMCLARTDWDVPKHRGLTWFAVPTDAPGVTVEPISQINGDAEFCQEFLDDVELTDDDVIGEVNEGWTVTQTMLVYERGAGIARATVGAPGAAGCGATSPT